MRPRLAIGVLALTASFAQIPQNLQFEVASFKPSKPGGEGAIIRPRPGGQQYEALNCPVKLMLQAAYRVKAEQITGGPGWLDSEPFDMEARAERPANIDELHVMLVNLLTERLHLKFHKEMREMSVYALTLDKGGSRMTPHESGNAGEVWIDENADETHVTMKATFAPMEYFAFRLSRQMDRPVIDLTHLKGGYDFNLEFSRDPLPGITDIPQTTGADAPNVYAAVKQQLGLELKAQRGPVEVFVIDHADKPTDN
jgi:uncharacterized protein (TIGR03435 family)